MTIEPGAPTPERHRVRRPGRPGAEAAAALLSSAVAMAAYCLALAVHGTYPFGPRSRAVNDLGNQFVPFHEHLWDLAHGRSTGDLLFNWGSGYGVPFLADFLTYLMDPFSWLTVLFPRDAVQAPVFLVTLLSMGLGAAMMTVWLGLLRPGSPWLRALLAVGYGVSAWSISNGFSDPMWTWGLVSFPLLGIAADWCLRRRRWVGGALLVTVAWAGNFYTAAMATLGMGLVLLVRLALDERPRRDRGRILLRAVAMTATGILLAAPVLTVTYKASRASQPPPVITYPGPPALRDYLAHLLPGGLYPSAPQISVGLLALLLVLAFPFMRRVPGRERALWVALLLVVALSYVWQPTILLWHGLAMPNGSPYRASIALTAMLVAVAWLALARGPRPGELLAGAGALAVLLLAVLGSGYLRPAAWLLTVPDAVLALGLLLLLHRHRGDRRVRIAITAALTCSVFIATAYNAFFVTVIRDQSPWWQPKRTIDAATLAAGTAVRGADSWPAGRSDPGPHAFADNDPLLLGGEGGAYYSSYVPEQSAVTLRGLGAGWFMHGRHLLSVDDPVGRAIMGVRSYLAHAPGSAHNGFVRRTVAAPPVVTLRPAATLDGGAPDTSVFARQERVLGARVYTVPALSYAAGPRPRTGPGGTWRLPGNAAGAAFTSFTATCAPGRSVYAYLPWFDGTLQANGVTYRRHAVFPTTADGILPLGAVPAGGRFTVALGTHRAEAVPRFPVGCLDPHALAAAIARLKATGPVRVTAGGHTIRATFRPGTRGTAVVSVPAVTGWRCSVNGGRAGAPHTLGGLIAVGLRGGSRLSCSYVTPGLAPGLWASGLALVVLLAAGLFSLAGVRRLVRRGGPPAREKPMAPPAVAGSPR
ncbi:YfhO family protein [Streptomyces sp. NBC_01476]|uniref:YfhO family protein n=1 Tax=Streptomyces sp. NBC_01476 TaxID=2903881 RepID=UPI002E3767A5|nr:YfhO family protein [Streptomyces sp. NBC_01476]